MRLVCTLDVKGEIFNIQRFCITDGEGIRTVVFMKGCPMRCKWCHNPESLECKRQLMFKASRCVGCGACVHACKQGVHSLVDGLHTVCFDRCVACGECLNVCCYDALEICGRSVTAEEVLRQIQPDLPFFGKNGGVTLSGGEPMAQPDFLFALLTLLNKEHVSVYVETNGYAKEEAFARISPLVDCFLFDWKLTDPELHKEYTGVSNTLIESNLRFLSAEGRRIVLRCPIIPGVNDTHEHFAGIAKLRKELTGVERVELMAYHTMGEGKKEQIGRSDVFASGAPASAAKDSWLQELRLLGCEAFLG